MRGEDMMTYYTTKELNSLGLTASLIKKLGEPDKVEYFKMMGRGECSKHLYEKTRVDDWIASNQDLLAKSAARKVKSAQSVLTRQANYQRKLNDILSRLAITNKIHIDKALEFAKGELDERLDRDQNYDQDITDYSVYGMLRAMLRHECTNYDQLLYELEEQNIPKTHFDYDDFKSKANELAMESIDGEIPIEILDAWESQDLNKLNRSLL